MYQQYETITDVFQNSFPPKSAVWSSPCSGTYTFPALKPLSVVPQSSVASFIPRSVVSWKRPSQDPSSFGAIVKSGIIKMTDYDVGSVVEENFVVGVPEGHSTTYFYNAYSGTCRICAGSATRDSRWTKNGDISSWSQQYPVPNPPDLGSFSAVDIAATRESTLSKFLGTFDLMTEMAESRETLAMFKSLNDDARKLIGRVFEDVPPSKRRRAARLTPERLLRSSDSVLRRVGSRWLQIRYGLLPLLYSYEELCDLVEDQGSFWKTYRSRRSVNVDEQLGATGDGIHLRVSGVIHVRSTYKVGFPSKRAAVLQRVNFNPLITAYNLTPLSFVLNWIVNVEDYIYAKAAVSLAVHEAGCTSVKTDLQLDYFLRVNTPLTWTSSGSNPCGGSKTVTLNRGVDQLIKCVTHDTYRRTSFTRGDVQLRLRNENLSWQRWTDAFFLSLNRASRLWR